MYPLTTGVSMKSLGYWLLLGSLRLLSVLPYALVARAGNALGAALYTRMSNTRVCELARRQRGRFGADMIERSASAKQVVRLLRSGVPVMLAADMDHGTTGSVFAPLFGVPACTLTSVSRLARLGGARVVPFVTEVLPAFRGYKLTIFDSLENFPTDSEALDACTMNAFLERQILRLPDQYY